MISEMMNWVGIVGAAFVVTCATLLFIARLPPKALPRGTREHGNASTFLFRDGQLADSENCEDDDPCGDWPSFRTWMLPRFPDLPLTPPGRADSVIFTAIDDPADRLRLETGDGWLRATLFTEQGETCAHRHRAALDRLERARFGDVAAAAPYPIWVEDREGEILWRNEASTVFFDRGGTRHDLAHPEPGERAIERVALHLPDSGSNIWFEVHGIGRAGDVIRYATDVTETVRAESARGEFIQTLTKTFANLTIGLAVFDSTRKLVLFNPALTDLTRLPVDFLSMTPDLMSFFDRLLDSRVMPEPRNYGSWRAQIGDMITSAENGLYQETWSLPSNITYRVTGRPHPDGAVAFLFEDISADIQLSRRYQCELEKRDAMLEGLDQAIMILTADQSLSLCNAAFRDLFGIDPEGTPRDMRLRDALEIGEARLPNPAFWSELRAILDTGDQEGQISHPSSGRDAPPLSARVARLPDGNRMVVMARRAGAEAAHA
ncbi:PAS-domain containing protein [Roseovarius sp. SCSIO 43702]|uniref:PAS-domain containing protein n=1 Tax=Roseovarius sp. SCSIO 43702 TaxID=2823043 RepID=UPI001C72A996|nr:PAS-domain containing protein [Roseovarius sp. SCSIO 43702]QYX56974.1 PAS-domain containing protein [Roseovarius sp. SCSIO 43702]